MTETDGEVLARKIEDAANSSGVATRRVSCTMGCERACNVIIQGADKIGYSLGHFEGSDADAEAIVVHHEVLLDDVTLPTGEDDALAPSQAGQSLSKKVFAPSSKARFLRVLVVIRPLS